MAKKIYYLFFCTLFVNVTSELTAQTVDPKPEHLTHSWTFEDGTANDQAGSADGTLMGDAYIENGSLFTYPEGEAWVDLPANEIALSSYEEITVEAWVIPGDNGDSFTMLTYFGNTTDGLGTNGYFISIARGDNISRTAISTNELSEPWAAESGANGDPLDEGTLYHVVSTLTNSEIALYIDGELQASSDLAENNDIASIGTSLAYIARGGYTDDPDWKGEILDINIYDKALTSDEVLFLFEEEDSEPTNVSYENSLHPTQFNLHQNYPNPFNPTTNIAFDMPEQSNVRIAVYNMLGQEIAVLVNEVKSAGQHTVNFDGSNLSSGIYIARMETNNRIFTNKMLLLK